MITIIDPKEFVRDWIHALRSGDYEQTHRTMRRDHETGPCFCAIGVAYDIAQVRYLHGDGCYHQTQASYVIDNITKAFNSIRIGSVIVVKNDVDLLSFAEIADYLEKRLEGLDTYGN